MISGDISPESWSNIAALDRLAKRLRLDLRDVAVHQSALAAYDLMIRMPPFASGGSGASMKISQRAGERAIANDLDKITDVPTNAKNPQVVFSTRNKQWIAKYAKGAVRVIPQDRIDLTGARLAGHHAASRNQRTGRTAYMGRNLLTTATVLARYVRIVQARVGSLAAGWKPAYYYFSSRDRIVEGQSGAVKLPPAFIMRHAGTGGVVDAMLKDGGGFLEGRMQYRFGSLDRLQEILYWVMRRREKDMGASMERRLSKHVLDFNTGLVRYVN